MLRGGGEERRRGRTPGEIGARGRRYQGQQPPRSVSAPRRTSSPAFQEREYCCLLNSSVSVGSLRRWGGTFGGGCVFFFTPVFFLNGELHSRKKKNSVKIRALASDCRIGRASWVERVGLYALGWPERVGGQGKRWIVLPSVKFRRICQAGASRLSPGILLPCLRAGLLSPCDPCSLVPAG